MSKIKMAMFGLVAMIGLALPQAANAVVTNVLWLSIDESGSIGQTNFNTQMDAYASALGGVIPTDGSIAIGAATFDDNTNSPVFSLITIDSAQDLQDLQDWATGWKALYTGGNTDIAEAIDFGVSSIAAFGLDCSVINCVIDISTDGSNNAGDAPVNTAVAAATAANITVNCLGIGAGADCDFATGFSITATTFGDVEKALITKLRRETGQDDVPEPAALLILGAGLLGLGAVGRRRRV